jgi:hypothetical protein
LPPWNFQGGYTIVRYFPGGIAIKYGNSKELKCLEIPGDPNKMSLFQGAFFIASLEFPGRVYNCKIFSRGYGNEIRKFQGIKMFRNSRGP